MKLDESVIEALTTALNITINEYNISRGTVEENKCFFRMNFIEKFSSDVVFSNDMSETAGFYRRYADFILRNMIEQSIEFLYISKNSELIEEYLGYAIEFDNYKKKKIVEKEKYFGEDRFVMKRNGIAKMTKDIGEYKAENGTMSLYDVYAILSDRCHNSYFSSLLDDVNSVNLDISKVGLSKEQVTLIYIMIACVLMEFPAKS